MDRWSTLWRDATLDPFCNPMNIALPISFLAFNSIVVSSIIYKSRVTAGSDPALGICLATLILSY